MTFEMYRVVTFIIVYNDWKSGGKNVNTVAASDNLLILQIFLFNVKYILPNKVRSA